VCYKAKHVLGKFYLSAPLESLRCASFRVGPFAVEPQRNAIVWPQGETFVEPKVMDVLCVLAERPGQVFSRDELIDRVWGVEFGGDESLTRAVSQLRKAFDPDQVIETIPKRGYRLVAPVSSATPPEEKSASSAPASARSAWSSQKNLMLKIAGAAVAILFAVMVVRLFDQVPANRPPSPAPSAEQPVVEGISVAIRPFASLNPAATSIAGALTEDLASALSHVKLLRVSTGGRHADAKLRYAVEGSVQQSGGRVLVDVQIADLASGLRVWTQEYERAYDGSLGARNTLSDTIASEVTPQLMLAAQASLKRRPILTLAPWELILLGTWTPGGTEVFLAPHTHDRDWLQRRALTLDPRYAPAHASLAQFLAYTALFNPQWDGKDLHTEIAQHAALAVAYAPFDADVLFQVATYERLEGDRAQAVATFKRVLALQPTHQTARIELPFVEALCQPDETAGIRSLQAIDNEMSRGDAARSVVLSHLADLYLARGSFAEARAAADQSRHIVRTTWAGITYAAASAELGRRDDALRAVHDVRLEWPNLDFEVFADRVVPRWCLDGARTGAVRGIFHRLARVEKAK